MNIYKYQPIGNTKPFRRYFYPKNIMEQNYLVTDYLWGSNTDKSYKIFGGITNGTIEENIENATGYLDWFRDYTKDIPNCEITHIHIDYIDRGIRDFVAFANMIKHLFPNIETLEFNQNYSYNSELEKNSDNITENDPYSVYLEYYKEFLKMLKILKLKNFRISDEQSKFFKFINIEDIFEIMPDDSVYVMRIDPFLLNDYCQDEMFCEKRGSKTLYLYDK